MGRPACAFGHLAAIFAFLLLFALSAPATAAEVVEINAQQLKNMMDNDDILVVFPLSLVEFNHMHIEGSVHIPLEDLEAQLPPNKEQKLAFYCLGRTWMAAPQAAGQAVALGYKNVFLFRDGLPAWALVGYSIKSIEVLPAYEVPTISTDELKTRLAGDEDFILLDIRTIDGDNYWIDDPRRLHIPLDEIPVRFNEIPEGKKLTLIDMLGRRTAIAARLLHSRGVQEMDKVGGGMNQWVINGFPVVKNE